jgi:cytochrome b6-f complex iron-sulfur subunit
MTSYCAILRMTDSDLPMKASMTSRARSPLTRRELLSYAWLLGLAALTAGLARAGVRAAQAMPRRGEFGGVFSLGPLSEAPTPGSEPVNQPAGRFWLHNPGDGLVSLHKSCTHLDCLCDWDDQNRQFVCPCHGSRFAEDGAVLSGPAARSLDRFVVQYADPSGEIVAETDPETGAALPVPGAAEGPQSTPEEAESDEEAAETAIPDYEVLVDTSRLIPGAPQA